MFPEVPMWISEKMASWSTPKRLLAFSWKAETHQLTLHVHGSNIQNVVEFPWEISPVLSGSLRHLISFTSFFWPCYAPWEFAEDISSRPFFGYLRSPPQFPSSNGRGGTGLPNFGGSPFMFDGFKVKSLYKSPLSHQKNPIRNQIC